MNPTKISFNFTDFLALAIIIACFLLIALGKDTVVGAVLISTVAYYFGRKQSE